MEAVMTYSQAFFGWLLQTTLIASLVICLILLMQKLLGGRLGPRWSYALWLVLLVRMILPWSPSSRVSLSNLIPSWQRQTHIQRSSGTIEVKDVSPSEQAVEAPEAITIQEAQSELAAEKQASPRPRIVANTDAQSGPQLLLLRRILPIFWLAGAIVIGVYLLVSDLALWRIVKRDRPLVNQAMLELFEECKAQMGVQSLVVVVPSDRVRSPGLFGFVRPRLLLPRQMLDNATTEEMRYVFLHELAHLRRHDIYLGWLTSLLQVLHWFNPLVWFAFYRMRADRELACDALVLTQTGQDKSQEYGGAILGLVRRFSRCRPLPAMAGIIETKSQLKRRIAMITKFRNKSYRFSPLAALLIIILAFISLPNAKRTNASETHASAPANQPKFTKIHVPTKLPFRGSGILSPDGQKLAFISGGSVWVLPVHGKSSLEISGTPVRLTEPMHAWDIANVSIAWSGNGKWIGFRVAVPKEDKNAEEELYIVSAEGGTPKRVPITWKDWAINVHTLRYALSSDGDTLYFTEGPKLEQTCIYSMSTDGGEKQQITEPITLYPAVSPDGSKIAYVRTNLGPNDVPLMQELWVKPLNGGESVLACKATGKTWFNSPVWSPDSNKIAFLSSADKGGGRFCQIWIVALSSDGIPVAPAKFELPKQTSNLLAGWTQDNKSYTRVCKCLWLND